MKQLEILYRLDPRALALHQKGNRIHAETRYAELQPVAHDLVELVAIDDVIGVEIGLELIEAVEVVLARFAVPCPGRLLHRREHRAGSVVARPLVAPDIPVPERRLGIGARRLEPGVLVGRMIGDEVDDDPHAERLGVIHQLDKVSGGAETRAYAVEVADVVAVVAVGRAVERLQPDAGDAETVQVIEPPA